MTDIAAAARRIPNTTLGYQQSPQHAPALLAPHADLRQVETPRLVMRRMSEADTAALHACYGDAEVMKYLRGAKTFEESVASVRRKIGLWDQHGIGLWTVVDKHNGAVIGHCGLVWSDTLNGVEIGFLIHKDLWGKGFATEAVCASVDAGFAQLNVDHIFSFTHPDNWPSRKVMENAGFRVWKEDFLWNLPWVIYRIDRRDHERGRGAEA